MFRKIVLENFKAFGTEQKIPLRPITLIYGPNSSGKTTILNSLLMLKQTYEESISPKTPLLYKGSLTDQQSYSRCVNSRDVGKTMKIGVLCALCAAMEERIDIDLLADFEKYSGLIGSQEISWDENGKEVLGKYSAPESKLLHDIDIFHALLNYEFNSYGEKTELDRVYCSITLVKTMDFSPRLSVATHFRHSRKCGNPGFLMVVDPRFREDDD